MKKNRGLIWIILLFFITLWRYWHLVTPNKELREYIMRDFIPNGQETAFLSALKKGSLLLWDVTTGGGALINNWINVFYPLNLLYLPFVRNDFIVHHVFQYMLVLHIWLMGVFAYLLLRELQASRPAAFIAGLIYSFNGYTYIHSMQLGLINTMTWLPLVFLFLERGRREKRLMPAIWGGFMLGIGILAGHAQIYYYMALAVVFYAMFWTVTGWPKETSLKDRLLPIGHLILLGLVAFGVSAIQTIPAYTLSVTSVHATAGPEFKWINPLKFYQLAMLVLPWGLDEVKDWGILVSERYAYMGWVTLIFGIAVLVWRRETKVYTYAIIAAFSLILAMGENSILFRFFYNYVPGYNMFRYPSRILVLFAFGMSVLAGLGLDHYLSESSPTKISRGLARILMVLSLGGLAIWVLAIGSLTASIETAFHYPLINFVSQLSLVLVIIWIWWGIVTAGKTHPVKSGLIAVIAAVVLFDLWSQGNISGAVQSPDRLTADEESAMAFLKERKDKGEHFRIENHFLKEALLRRYEISSYNTGNRLMNTDYLELMWAADYNPRILDLLNVRYIVGLKSPPEERQKFYLNLNLMQNELRTKTFEFSDRPVQTDRVEVHSHLSFAAHIPQGKRVAELTLSDKKGHSFKLPIRAGIETAEWAIDRPNLKAKHRPADIVRSWAVENEGYKGHHYRAILSMPQAMEIVKVELRYLRLDGQMEVSRMIIGGKDIAILTERFENVAPSIFRNRYAFQRAFLVPEAKVITDPQEMMSVIRWFDPGQTVLLNKQPSTPKLSDGEIKGGEGSVKILSYSPWKILIKADTSKTQHLVLSDTYHPWWRARIDGKGAEVLKADLALRAVVLPQGKHEVEFYLVPVSFYWGAAITFSTLLLVVAAGYLSRKRQA